jgi:hypothetical protein
MYVVKSRCECPRTKITRLDRAQRDHEGHRNYTKAETKIHLTFFNLAMNSFASVWSKHSPKVHMAIKSSSKPSLVKTNSLTTRTIPRSTKERKQAQLLRPALVAKCCFVCLWTWRHGKLTVPFPEAPLLRRMLRSFK